MASAEHDIRVQPTKRDAALAAADLIEAHIDSRPRSDVGLAGGSSPIVTYESLAERGIPWDRVTFWLGDERWVTADHPDSNAGMARRTLGPGAARVMAPDAGLGDPADVAAEYAAVLAEMFVGDGDEAKPQLVLLGMGDDGHTASLFPETGALDVMDADYVANRVDRMDTWRLTATFPLLWGAEHLVFLVTGEDKAAVLADILDRGAPYPAQRVAAGATRVTWLLDGAAASHLEKVSSSQ